jgi:prepilin-type N-terminal cleavage/methylation domain-containing protein
MHPSFSSKRAFTLTEMLVVLAIMTIITAIGVPSLFSVTNSGKMNESTSDLAGILEQARQYAAAQNTYVWVALQPQTVNNVDVLNVAVVASNDGTDPGVYGNVPSSAFQIVTRIRTFQHLQLKTAGTFTISQLASLPASPTAGPANNLSSTATFNIRMPGAGGTTPFTQSIEFTPSGEARNTTSPIDFIEIGLEPASTTSSPNPSNAAVLRVNGITGLTAVYRE